MRSLREIVIANAAVASTVTPVAPWHPEVPATITAVELAFIPHVKYGVRPNWYRTGNRWYTNDPDLIPAIKRYSVTGDVYGYARDGEHGEYVVQFYLDDIDERGIRPIAS